MNVLQVAEIVSDKVASVLFLQQRRILHNPRDCNNCARPMTLSLRDKGDRWRCSARGCRREVGPTKGHMVGKFELVVQECCSVYLCLVERADEYGILQA